MTQLKLTVMSLRYSSWSIRSLVTLLHAGLKVGAEFEVHTVMPNLLARWGDDPTGGRSESDFREAHQAEIGHRRALGSVNGFFPVLRVDGVPIHETLAICEWAAETFPEAGLWPSDTLRRAQARSTACEMVGGFMNIRGSMSCQLAAEVPNFKPNLHTELEIDRVQTLIEQALQASGGPFLFGDFGIADAMYLPVLSRFHTYGIETTNPVKAYAQAVRKAPAVQQWLKMAQDAPALPTYDAYIEGLGGTPTAWTF